MNYVSVVVIEAVASELLGGELPVGVEQAPPRVGEDLAQHGVHLRRTDRIGLPHSAGLGRVEVRLQIPAQRPGGHLCVDLRGELGVQVRDDFWVQRPVDHAGGWRQGESSTGCKEGQPARTKQRGS